ncbi:MAG TPA: site-2 protease family protein [Acidobacteriaceae bacterium]|nr:site-2 protease family protein [Acidobacteriaceae bacterium]
MPKISLPSQNVRLLRDFGIPLVLFALSVLTTTAIGARFMHNFLLGYPTLASDSDLWPWPWLFQHPERIRMGWPFSVTLLAILLTHEFGHYFACRAHGIRATLPWVLPAPTLSGTAGAVIQIQGRIPSRRALVDIGAYGPLSGYVASVAAIALGLILSRPLPAHAPHSLIDFGEPLTIHILAAILHAPSFHHALYHPVLIAGWIGLFVTALNLIPGGQLDGGHLLYSLSPALHRWTTRLLPILLILLGVFLWIGWILWGAMLLLPILRRHPNIPASTPLGPTRILACLLSLVVFALTFAAEPFLSSSLLQYLR